MPRPTLGALVFLATASTTCATTTITRSGDLDAATIGRDGPQQAAFDGPPDGSDGAVLDASLDASSDLAGIDAGRSTRVGVNSTWHIDLEAPVDTTVTADWYDIDLFDNSDAVIRSVRASGHRVVCYFSAGSGEEWRPDYASIPRSALGAALDGWPGERWLNVRDEGVRRVMLGRMDLAARKGCDGVDPDNVDGYANRTGFEITAAHQLEYNHWLAREAHARALVIGLKNNVEQIPALLPSFDFAINEQCFRYGECDAVAAFTAAGRGVLQIEYGDPATLSATVCPRAAALRFFTILPGADRLAGAYARCPR